MAQGDPGAGEEARQARADFLYHLMIYVFVNALLVIIDRRGGTSDQAVLGLDWAYWLILFWGLGVVGHAIAISFGDRRVAKLYERGRDRDLATR